jgi:RNA polymerase sigma-70 factor, ECF subfamily
VPDRDSDSELAQRAAAGDRVAFATLATRHYDRVHALAWRWCGARAEAEDVAQETMVKLAQAIRGFRGESAFSTWLYRIAYTTAVDHLRARARVEPQEEAVVDGVDDDTPEQATMRAQLWRAVRTLPDQQRDAVLLVYGEDMAHGEAAQVLGCSEKTVSWRLHEARKRLKTMLEAVE